MPLSRRDVDFLLHELLDVEALTRVPRYGAHDRGTFAGVLDTAWRIATEAFAPHAARGDAEEPRLVDGRVVIIPEVGAALRAYCDAGFVAAAFDEELGGLQLPWTVVQACAAVFSAANIATTAYPFLTIAAANMLNAFGSAEQKSVYLPPMLAGRWFGTMCLSEPQAGSSLADIRTRAEPLGAGRYRITGSKMWISGGEHDLSENIVHMVLAKVPGGPPGVKGISLFIVPKFLPGAGGAPGERNDIALAGLNHKMGYRGTVNTLLAFGEQGRCTGWLLGEEHRGLACMFHMMNEARIGVGLGAAALACAGYRVALEYARGRPQGRPLDSRDPLAPQVPIIAHADIRRLLLAQKAAAEGALALVLHCARLIDVQRSSEDPAERADAGLLLEMLTPIAKSWPSEFGLEANKHAIQVLGGYGYTRDYPVERLYRDNRLNAIHEGTHGIQALDLLGRKVPMRDGAAFAALLACIRATAGEAASVPACAEAARALGTAADTVAGTTAVLMQARGRGAVRVALANATPYLDMLGHLVVGWMWLRQARVAAVALDAAAGADRDFYTGKLAACRYYFRYEMPRIDVWARLLESLDDTCVTVPDGGF